MSLDQLNKKHPAYVATNKRLHFQYASYIGGDTYRKGAYLRKYWGEDQAPFDAYGARLDVTPLDNHVKTTVDIYRSYLWRNPPQRTLDSTSNNPFVIAFLDNSDYQGQSLDSFLKTAFDWAMVLGWVWVGVDRPAIAANSAAEEIQNNIRAYLTMYTPQMVTDWEWDNSGYTRKLKYLKVIEKSSGNMDVIKVWYPDRVERYVVEMDEYKSEYITIHDYSVVPNPLGKIPFIDVTPMRSPVTGMGESILNDVADIQRSIYNKLSELEQTIRMSGHPSLVKTADTKAVSGAGGIIEIPENMDPGLYPQLLQPSGTSIDSILAAINHDIESINNMTHLSAIRGTKGSAMSGIALQTERQLLNSKLSDLADIAQESELKIWELWFEWMDMDWPGDFDIEYHKSFDTRDPGYEQSIIEKSLQLVSNEEYRKWAEKEIVKITVKDEVELQRILDSIDNQPVEIIDDLPDEDSMDDDV